jgi:hypothetical protein
MLKERCINRSCNKIPPNYKNYSKPNCEKCSALIQGIRSIDCQKYPEDGSSWFLQNTGKLTFILPALRRGVPVQMDLVVR